MKPLLMVLTAAFLIGTTSARIDARIQNPIVCWESDIEFPVPCTDDDDD